MLKQPIWSLVLSAGMAILLLVLSLTAGQEPLLGLDLQGGVEVVLEPVDTPENLALATEENLDLAVEILRKRVDAIGVAEPDITTQTGGGNNFIVVQLPGIDDEAKDEAVALVGTTAQLQFRPLLLNAGPDDSSPFLRALDDFGDEITNGGPDLSDMIADPELLSDPTIAPPDQSAVFLSLPDETGRRSRVLVGPTEFTGTALSGAEALFINGGWLVQVTFKSGDEGLNLFNEVAEQCFVPNDELLGPNRACQFGQLSFVLDGVVESSPRINSPVFTDRNVQITRDFGFPEDEARQQALVLDFGALPLAFSDPVESGLVNNVSASLGRDSLDAGLLAGAVGLALVALYMIWYYRLLGLAAMLSLAVSATLLWVIVSFLSVRSGLALTLAGVVGLIVSIGVSLDSNVIFFEDLKETMRRGDSLSLSVNKAFPKSFGTVFWANLATLIGALILYLLTVGSVKGFALMLAIASVLDLLATFFFMAPLVRLLADRFGDKPSMFGLRTATGTASPEEVKA